MEIILKQDVDGLGEIGQIRKVAPGYARNYLIPNQFAVQVNPQNLRALEHEKLLLDATELKNKEAARELAGVISGLTCTIARRAGEGDRLFGSVTNIDIANSLAEQNVIVDRRSFDLAEPIKELGIFMIPINLYPDIIPSLRVVVVREAE
tara:strand:- start:142 stop:591 length:450 start_codon:yes stop_codon:yes gene_type:complete